MHLVYRVIQNTMRKSLGHTLDCRVVCECSDFSSADRICYALSSVSRLEDSRFYFEFSVEVYFCDDDYPFE